MQRIPLASIGMVSGLGAGFDREIPAFGRHFESLKKWNRTTTARLAGLYGFVVLPPVVKAMGYQKKGKTPWFYLLYLDMFVLLQTCLTPRFIFISEDVVRFVHSLILVDPEDKLNATKKTSTDLRVQESCCLQKGWHCSALTISCCVITSRIRSSYFAWSTCRFQHSTCRFANLDLQLYHVQPLFLM